MHLSYFFSEFSKKIDADLPFYHPSGSHRFREEEPSFDEAPARTPRLHMVAQRRRDDGALFMPGRATIAGKGSKSVRDTFFRFDVGMPPLPPELLSKFAPH